MQLARSTLRLFSFTAFGVLSVCIIRAEEKPKMQAVVAHEYGAPDVLKIDRIQRPEPNDDEALVRVIASSVNPADPLTLSGKYAKEFGTHLPLIPGYDIAGVVEKTGANVTRLKVGDAVYGYPTLSLVTLDRKSTRLNSSHRTSSYASFCQIKKMKKTTITSINRQTIKI